MQMMVAEQMERTGDISVVDESGEELLSVPMEDVAAAEASSDSGGAARMLVDQLRYNASPEQLARYDKLEAAVTEANASSVSPELRQQAADVGVGAKELGVLVARAAAGAKEKAAAMGVTRSKYLELVCFLELERRGRGGR